MGRALISRRCDLTAWPVILKASASPAVPSPTQTRQTPRRGGGNDNGLAARSARAAGPARGGGASVGCAPGGLLLVLLLTIGAAYHEPAGYLASGLESVRGLSFAMPAISLDTSSQPGALRGPIWLALVLGVQWHINPASHRYSSCSRQWPPCVIPFLVMTSP